MRYIITLDVGKKETKAKGRALQDSLESTKKVQFETKLYFLDKGYIDVAGNSHHVVLEGKEFIIGEQGVADSTETSKTSFVHKAAAYTAISKFIEPDTENNKIDIVLACPLSVLKVKEAKEKYKEYIKGDGEINIEVDGKKYKFSVENIMVKAEGSGYLYTNKAIFTNQDVAVVDFGGLNMGFSLYRNGVCSPEDRFIDEHGVNKLIKLTKTALEGLKEGNLISFQQAEKYLNNGYMTKLGQIDILSQEEIRKVKEEFVESAVSIIEKNGFRLEQYDGIVFVGGTTQKIKEQLQDRFPNANIPVNSQWSTVDGLYLVACKKYGK